MPRARLATPDGGTTEWASAAVPRYQRRTARVDEAILGVYLSGGNTRRLKGALAPLLRRAAREGRGLAPGGPAGRRFRDLAPAAARDRGHPLPLRRRLVSVRADREAARAGAHPGDAGRARQRGARGAGSPPGRARVGRGWRDAIDALVARGLRAPVLAVV